MLAVYSTLAVGDLGAHSTPEGVEDLAALSTLEVVALVALSTQVATITMEGHLFQQALGRGDITTNTTGGGNKISRKYYPINQYQSAYSAMLHSVCAALFH